MVEIVKLKENFDSVKSLRDSITDLLMSLTLKVTELKSIYSELLDNSKTTNSLLDTLYFQTKLITIELKNINDMFNLIDNRIYGDYYKQYKMIVKYCSSAYTDNNSSVKISDNNFPIYNDLDFTTQYQFSITQDIYNTIISLLESMERDLANKNLELIKEETKKTQGIDIDNLIHNHKFNNTILRENIELFKLYTESYNKFHKKYFSSFYIKVKLFYSQIDRDINIRKSPQLKTKTQDNIHINGTDIDNIKDLISDSSEYSSVTEELNNIFSYISVNEGEDNSYIYYTLDNISYTDISQIDRYNYFSDFIK